MRVKANVSFAGILSMHKGQEMDIQEGEVLTDLLSCLYVEPVEVPKAPKKRGVKANEDK